MSKFNKRSYQKLMAQVSAFNIENKNPPDWIRHAEPTPLSQTTFEFQEFCNRKNITDDDLAKVYQ